MTDNKLGIWTDQNGMVLAAVKATRLNDEVAGKERYVNTYVVRQTNLNLDENGFMHQVSILSDSPASITDATAPSLFLGARINPDKKKSLFYGYAEICDRLVRNDQYSECTLNGKPTTADVLRMTLAANMVQNGLNLYFPNSDEDTLLPAMENATYKKAFDAAFSQDHEFSIKEAAFLADIAKDGVDAKEIVQLNNFIKQEVEAKGRVK